MPDHEKITNTRCYALTHMRVPTNVAANQLIYNAIEHEVLHHSI